MSPISTTIRPMQPEEAEQVAGLFRNIVIDLDYYTPEARENELERYAAENLEIKISNDPLSILVAICGDALAGFCISRWDDYTIWLEWVGVDPSFRKMGIAQILLEALEKDVKKRNAHKIWCDSRTSNQQSIELLERCGYKKIVEIKNHWYSQDFFLWHKEVI